MWWHRDWMMRGMHPGEAPHCTADGMKRVLSESAADAFIAVSKGASRSAGLGRAENAKKPPAPPRRRDRGLDSGKKRLVLVGVHLEVEDVEAAGCATRVHDLRAVTDLTQLGVSPDDALRDQVI